MNDVHVMLRRWRKMTGQTLAQVANATGLSVSFLSDIERGKTTPSLATLDRLAEAFGADLVVAFVVRGEE